MNHDITLPIGSTAEPETCGSCKYFRRRSDGDAYGYCNIKMPPQKQYFADKVFKNDDEIEAANFTRDSNSCDLWKWDGKQYIVQRRVGS